MRSLLSRLAASAFVAATVAGCADQAGPSAPQAEFGKVATATTAVALDTTSGPAPLRFVSWAPKLETYDTTFVVTQGVASSDTIYFRATPYLGRLPYLVLSTPADAQFVAKNGKPARDGQTISLRVIADSTRVAFSFEPHGSTFTANPAVLKVSWVYTDLLSRLGTAMRLYYQLDDGTWSLQPATVDLKFYWLVFQLEHFSNYRVAF